MEREEFHRVGQKEQMLFGIYFGLLAFAALLNAFVFAHVRESTYLTCSLLILCFSLFQASVNGIDLEYLWPERRDWNAVAIPLFCGLSAMAASVFAWRFLELSERAPRLRILMLVLVGAGGTAALSAALGGITLGGLLGSIVAPLTVLGLGLMGAVSFLRGCRHAGYFMLAGVLELAGLALDGLHRFGILPRTFLTAYGDEIGSTLFIIVVSLALTARFDAIRRDRLAAERVAVESLRRAAEAKLQALQAKINPHFLFNALSTIAGLIREAPERAEATVVKLARLFRYTLTATEQPRVTLSEELAVVRSYLEIEQARFGDKLKFEIYTEGSMEGLTLPGLTLQPLVENSVKHGLRPKASGGKVVVRVQSNGERCHITVEDDGVGMGDSQHQKGHGLASVRERLRLAYGNCASMTLSGGSGLRVDIGLPVRIDA
jgi:two-component sensor histidine kinase